MLLGDVPGVILDLGCGEGRLVRYLRDSGMRVVGVDPSASMLRRARKRSVPVVRANGQALPFADDSIAAAVVTYPGPWIAERDVWIELARVVRPTGSVVLLVGGSYERGHAHRIRRVAARLAYGREREHDVTPLSSQPWEPDFSGTSIHRQDGWGMVAFWCGVRRAQEPDPFRVSGPSSS
jgi:SAM-dependent methyltransferase